MTQKLDRRRWVCRSGATPSESWPGLSPPPTACGGALTRGVKGLVPAIVVLFNRRMSAFVYMMTNRRNGILYTGVTTNMPRRGYEHREGLVAGFTKRYGTEDVGLLRSLR